LMPDSCPSSQRFGHCSLTRRARRAAKTPNPELQAPEKFQVPILKNGARTSSEFWSLGLLWNLDFGT
jgi:hypothetical protein